MSLTHKLILKALETGIIPERITRAWVRRMCNQAIERASLGDSEAEHAVFRQILKELKAGAFLRYKIDDEIPPEQIEPDFYALIYGKRLNESCCYFPTGAEDLDEAEDTMLWMSADRARIRDGMKILELGCGWGAMTFWLARQFPQAQITAITESTSRTIFLQKKLNELEIKNVKFIASEFADLVLNEKFDRIICLERFDFFSKDPTWEEKMSRWLNPDGKIFFQQQVHASSAYFTDSVGLASFPAHTLIHERLVLSAEMLLMFQKYFHIEDSWKISGEQYRMTAEKWLAKLYDNRMEILPLLEKTYGKKMAWTWLQRWRLFLISQAEKSGYNRGQEWPVAQYLFAVR